MNNYINFFNNILSDPSVYHRSYEHDLPSNKDEESKNWQSQATRIALISLPFLSLYRPLGFTISVSMGACRIVTHCTDACRAGYNAEKARCTFALAKTALAVIAFTAVIFNNTLGQCITTFVDGATDFSNACHHLHNGKYEQAMEEFLQAITALFYLTVMTKGTLEANLIVSFLQTATSFYQAVKEYQQEKYPEAVAKALMGILRLNQSKNYLKSIQKRNHLEMLRKQRLDHLKMIRERDQFLLQIIQKRDRAILQSIQNGQQLIQSPFGIRALKGREITHLPRSPLFNLSEQIEKKRVVLSDAKGKEYDFGSHFYPFGKGLVKGNNLTFRTKVINGQELNELDFKINHVFRSKVGKWIQQLKEIDPQEIQKTLSLTGSRVRSIKIEEKSFPIGSQEIGPAYKIIFEGVGTIQIGASPYYHNLHNRVIVQLDKDKTLFDLNEIISLMDLHDVLVVSTEEDIARMKMGHLFRNFCPRPATNLERTEAFFELPIDQLKEEIIKQAPEMKEIFDTYFDKMKEQEIFPGRMRFSMLGLAGRAHQLGARALTASITGTNSDAETFERVASILKMGMVSLDTRFTNGIKIEGIDDWYSFHYGSEDSVFTQMLTLKNLQEKLDLNWHSLVYFRKVQVLISLNALESGTYQSQSDIAGSRINLEEDGYDYLARPGIDQFIQNQQDVPFANARFHEIMIKERIPPSLIKGLIVIDTQTRDNLISHLRMYNLIKKDDTGSETINGIPLNQFVRVGNELTEELVDISK